MWMIIDDMRDLNCDIIARTSQAGFKILKAMHTNIKVLVLDHDLGPESDVDGAELLKALILSDILPSKIQLCSSNPIGLANMQRQLVDAGYNNDAAGREFWK